MCTLLMVFFGCDCLIAAIRGNGFFIESKWKGTTLEPWQLVAAGIILITANLIYLLSDNEREDMSTLDKSKIKSKPLERP